MYGSVNTNFHSEHDMSGDKTVLICIAIFILFIACALPTAELVIGAKHAGTITCANDTLVNPTTWLEVMGGVSLAVFGCILLSLLCALFAEEFLILVAIIMVPAGLFSTAWTIVGAVMLWRDNLDCKPQELHDMLWASIIIRLLAIASACCSSGKYQIRE